MIFVDACLRLVWLVIYLHYCDMQQLYTAYDLIYTLPEKACLSRPLLKKATNYITWMIAMDWASTLILFTQFNTNWATKAGIPP